jgi:outer membrane protein TolC
MANKFLVFCMSIAAFLARPGSARADGPLTLEAALALAREHNRDLSAARARLDQSRSAIEQARAALLPSAVAQGKYTHNNKQVEIDLGAFGGGDADPIVVQKSEQLDALISATVPLVVPSAYYQLSAAKQTQGANEASYRANEAAVLLDVAQAYFAAIGTDELVRARQKGVEVARETLEVARARVAAQVANRVDATRAETALVRAEQDLEDSANARAIAYRAFVTVLGTREQVALATEIALPPEPPPLPALVSRAQSERAELAAQRGARGADQASARAAAWRWAPTLSGFGNARAFNYAGFSGDTYAWAVGVQLDWVLFDGGLRDAERHRSEARGREDDARLDLLTDSIGDEVANAHGTLQTKRKAVLAAERATALARDTLGLVRAQYSAGTALQLDVLSAQEGLVTAEVSLARAHFDVSLADLALRRAVGTFPGRP